MKYLDYLLRDEEYLEQARDFTKKHFLKKNRKLIDDFRQGNNKKFPNDWTVLNEIINRKQGFRCGLCEKKLNDDYSTDIEHYRPKSVYWWLAYNYQNYYLACGECNRRYKKTTFPLFDETKRVDYFSRKNINQEQPLLVNPIFDNSLDYFELYFRISYNNKPIVVLKIRDDLDKNGFEYKKAKTTIDTLNLDLSTRDSSRHRLFNDFFYDLMRMAIKRRQLSKNDFKVYCKKLKQDETKTYLFSLGLTRMVFRNQFKIDKFVMNNYWK